MELPGVKVFEAAAAAPVDLMNLASKQASETLSVLNNGVASTLSAMSLPEIPALTNLLPGVTPASVSAKSASRTVTAPQAAASNDNGASKTPVKVKAYGED